MSDRKIIIDEFELVEIVIPDGKGGTVTLQVPPLDCISLQESQAINNEIEKLNEENVVTATALVQTMLKYWNKTKKQQEAIDRLTLRQISNIDKEWQKYSEIDLTVGESSVSEDN